MSRILYSPRALLISRPISEPCQDTRARLNIKINFAELYSRCACTMNLNKRSVKNLERKEGAGRIQDARDATV